MVQQNLLCQTCRDDKSFKKSGVSSKDLQGLSWLFCEDCIQEDLKSLAWTIEICPSCHYKVDEKNKIRIDMFYASKRTKR